MGGGDEDKHLMFFPGLMQMRQGSTAGHAFSLPGFPPQVHLPMPGPYPPPLLPGAHTYARPGYAYAQANAYAYPPPPAGPYAYPPQGYPHPGSSAPHQGLLGHGSTGHGGGRQTEAMESKPKAGVTAATASATPAYGGISHESSGHGGGRQAEMIESTPRAGGAAAATASASAYGALNKLSRGRGSRNGAFGFFGNWCGGHHGTFKHAAGHGRQGKFKRGHRPAKVEHVHGNFRAKCTTWKY